VRLLGDLPQDEMQRFADDLVLFDAAFAYLVGWSPGPGAASVTIFLIRDRELAARLHLGRGIAGWAHITLEGAYCAVEARADYGQTRETLFHEYTHVLLRRGRRAPLPRWYDEGIASFFGTLDARSGAVVVGAVPGADVMHVHRRGPLPLDQLFEGNLRGASCQEVAHFYATSWALSHYLLLTPAGRREMARLEEELTRGSSPQEAQRVAFGRSAERVESELRAHVAGLARGVPVEAIFELDSLEIRSAGRATPLAGADAADELGRMALQLASGADGDAADRTLARHLLEMAASQRTPPARSEAALAEALALAGQGEQAKASLRGALERAPEDPRVRLSAGRVELAQAETDEGESAARALAAAELHLRSSLELDAGSAPAWFELGRALRQARRPEQALDALHRARSLGWSAGLDLALGELELERGDERRGFDLLWPLVQDPHGGSTRDRASRLLEDAGLLPEPAGAR
jgi:hypothetical protein